ncbi:hypothetical protein LMG31884_42660 [Xanthomonas hydrangeae]|nr:hypothetical protein LMG31884_42660 [Xanthomonas hydrangeae]CAD7728770.1 hypothetical protein LMG31884_42660 [Xanthomonas hydrangeae]CAD7744335.1 hypothetical protein LMG31887_42580 [Xanthomonas hydrangeae]CAD7744338.1 hypothetical protein LMG31887_42580 [Xanthomonas hydrangeae]
MEKKPLPDGVTTYHADAKDIASYGDASTALSAQTIPIMVDSRSHIPVYLLPPSMVLAIICTKMRLSIAPMSLKPTCRLMLHRGKRDLKISAPDMSKVSAPKVGKAVHAISCRATPMRHALKRCT